MKKLEADQVLSPVGLGNLLTLLDERMVTMARECGIITPEDQVNPELETAIKDVVRTRKKVISDLEARDYESAHKSRLDWGDALETVSRKAHPPVPLPESPSGSETFY